MTYEAKIGELDAKTVRKTVVSCIKTYGKKNNIRQMFGGSDRAYLAKNPSSVIELLDNGKIRIRSSTGKKRHIEGTKSKLLKMI